MKVLGVIPARLASTRLPRKVLRELAGELLLAWVYRAAKACPLLDEVVVAADSEEVQAVCRERGWPCVMTSPDLPSGTDRLHAVSQQMDATIYVNVQGDEPLVPPEAIRACAAPLLADSTVEMGSVFAPCPEEEWDNPAVVKVVTALNGDALYFSRYAVPFPRSPRTVEKHLGLYAFRRDVLRRFATWPQTPLEIAESLEQLRFLENGVRIRMSEGQGSALAVDTPEQAEQVREAIRLMGL